MDFNGQKKAPKKGILVTQQLENKNKKVMVSQVTMSQRK